MAVGTVLLDILIVLIAAKGRPGVLRGGRTGATLSEQLRRELETAFGKPFVTPPVPDATVSFDDQSSPWSTLCEVGAPDRPRLLLAIAVAFAAAGASVHTASVATVGKEAIDRFELTDSGGEEVPDAMQEASRRNLAEGIGAAPGRRRLKSARLQKAATHPRHSGDRAEISAS